MSAAQDGPQRGELVAALFHAAREASDEWMGGGPRYSSVELSQRMGALNLAVQALANAEVLAAEPLATEARAAEALRSMFERLEAEQARYIGEDGRPHNAAATEALHALRAFGAKLAKEYRTARELGLVK